MQSFSFLELPCDLCVRRQQGGLLAEDRGSSGEAGRKRASERSLVWISSEVAALLEEPVDLADRDTPWAEWWTSAYGARNALVHEGGSITPAEAQLAWDSTRSLIEHLQSRVRAIRQIAPLRDQLEAFQAQRPSPPHLRHAMGTRSKRSPPALVVETG